MTEKILQLHTEKNIFWTLLGILLLCTAFYMYAINLTIHNVVSRQNLDNKASELTLSISSKEYTYITMRNNITLPLAYSLGFKDVSEKTFVSRNSTSFVSYLSRE